MGRNKNRDNRSAVKRRQPGLQAGGRPSGSLKKDLGVPAFFKQRKQAEREQSQPERPNGKSRQLSDEGVVGNDAEESVLLNNYAKGSHDATQDVADTVRSSSDGRQFERAARDLALSGKRDSSVKAFMRDMKNVIDNSDVILQILDARDPQGSRSRQTERMAMSSGKKVVLILNKVDLIPTANLQAWLRYLRNDFPTLAFKASTQQQRSNLKQGRGQLDLPTASSNGKMSFGSEAIGANALLQLLKNYARTAVKGSNVKQQLTVGVVGPPNVGKSSLINSLLRTRACAVASTPGWTKVVQGVMLEKGIRLLDCPGVALNAGMGDDDGARISNDDAAWNTLRNTVKVELIEDPIAPIQAMLKRVDAPQLVQLYNIEGGFNEGDAHDFLLRVALLRGKLARGGIPDLEGAARIVLHDWNIGRISFYSEPPAVHASLTKAGGAAGDAVLASTTSEPERESVALTAGSSLVTSFGEAFDLGALLGEADAEALGVKMQSEQGGALKGKTLVQARERVYAKSAVEGEQAEAIEVEEEELIAAERPADTSRSTLGKRRRGMDAMADSSDEEEEEEEGEHGDDYSAGNESDADDVITADIAIAGALPTTLVAGVKAPPPLTLRQRELQMAFGEQELMAMAQKRGDVRKAAKKAQKRLRKSGAGLVDAWTSGMDLRGAEGESGQHADPEGERHGQHPVAEMLAGEGEEEEVEEEEL